MKIWARRYARAYADMYSLAGRYFPLVHWYVRFYREAVALRRDASQAPMTTARTSGHVARAGRPPLPS